MGIVGKVKLKLKSWVIAASTIALLAVGGYQVGDWDNEKGYKLTDPQGNVSYVTDSLSLVKISKCINRKHAPKITRRGGRLTATTGKIKVKAKLTDNFKSVSRFDTLVIEQPTDMVRIKWYDDSHYFVKIDWTKIKGNQYRHVGKMDLRYYKQFEVGKQVNQITGKTKDVEWGVDYNDGTYWAIIDRGYNLDPGYGAAPMVPSVGFAYHRSDSTSNHPTNNFAFYACAPADTASAVLTDRMGNHNGTLKNGMALTESNQKVIYLASLSGDGGNNTMNLGALSELDNTSKFTISMWVRQTTLDAYDIFFDRRNVDDDTHEIRLLTHPNGNIYMAIDSTDNMSIIVTDYSQYVSANTWSHWVAVFDGTQADNAGRGKFYIDGVQRADDYLNDLPAATSNLLVGAECYIGDSLATDGFNGLVTGVAICSTAWSAEEVLKEYAATVDAPRSLPDSTEGYAVSDTFYYHQEIDTFFAVSYDGADTVFMTKGAGVRYDTLNVSSLLTQSTRCSIWVFVAANNIGRSSVTMHDVYYLRDTLVSPIPVSFADSCYWNLVWIGNQDTLGYKCGAIDGSEISTYPAQLKNAYNDGDTANHIFLNGGQSDIVAGQTLAQIKASWGSCLDSINDINKGRTQTHVWHLQAPQHHPDSSDAAARNALLTQVDSVLAAVEDSLNGVTDFTYHYIGGDGLQTPDLPDRWHPSRLGNHEWYAWYGDSIKTTLAYSNDTAVTIGQSLMRPRGWYRGVQWTIDSAGLVNQDRLTDTTNLANWYKFSYDTLTNTTFEDLAGSDNATLNTFVIDSSGPYAHSIGARAYTTGYDDLGDLSALNSSAAWTIAMWFTDWNVSHSDAFLFNKSLADNSKRIWIYTQASDSTFRIYVDDGDNANVSFATHHSYRDSIWYYLAVRFNAGAVSVWINGDSLEGGTESGTFPSTSPDLSSRSAYTSFTSDPWNGAIQDLMVFNTALTSQRIAKLANRTSPWLAVPDTVVDTSFQFWALCSQITTDSVVLINTTDDVTDTTFFDVGTNDTLLIKSFSVSSSSVNTIWVGSWKSEGQSEFSENKVYFTSTSTGESNTTKKSRLKRYYRFLLRRRRRSDIILKKDERFTLNELISINK